MSELKARTAYSIAMEEDPDCCKAIKNLKDNSKRNWIPDSKGGEPNYRKK